MAVPEQWRQDEWEEASRFGFVSAGGRSPSGRLYSRGLHRLRVGDRIWVHAPGRGYLGVARVAGPPAPLDEFVIRDGGAERKFTEVTTVGWHGTDKGEGVEHFVPVQWLDRIAVDGDPFNEAGLFGNQNIVVQPQDPKWLHTIERLKSVFPSWDVAGQT